MRLADSEQVRTDSEGEGVLRALAVLPKKKEEPAAEKESAESAKAAEQNEGSDDAPDESTASDSLVADEPTASDDAGRAGLPAVGRVAASPEPGRGHPAPRPAGRGPPAARDDG